MEDLLPKKHYSCKARSGLSKHCKPMAGLIIQTVNFFQDETKCHRSTSAPLLAIPC
jgi:hypothetical protein